MMYPIAVRNPKDIAYLNHSKCQHKSQLMLTYIYLSAPEIRDPFISHSLQPHHLTLANYLDIIKSIKHFSIDGTHIDFSARSTPGRNL